MGVPLNHPFKEDFPLYINHPAIGDSPFMETTMLNHIWLVVWNMIFFSIIYMGCHPSHLADNIFQDG